MDIDPRFLPSVGGAARKFAAQIAGSAGCVVYVSTQNDRSSMRRLLKEWVRLGWIAHTPSVMVDPTLEPDSMEARRSGH